MKKHMNTFVFLVININIRSDQNVFKVFYQESKTQVAVREKTKTMYVEGESVREIRQKLAQLSI